MAVRKVYAVKLKDKESLMNSSSGGAFTALSDVFLKQGNAVLCSIYDYSSFKPRFQLVLTFEERDCARGSKYVQADMNLAFRESVDWLESHNDRKLAFFGLGCQAASFQQYMKLSGLEDRVVIVDIICHGVPSPKIWREYAKEVSNDGIMSQVNFRDKKTGWNKSVGTAIVEGTEVSVQDYRRLYSTRNIIRPSCFACPYAKSDRDSDITIGDFWHIEKVMPDFYDPMGVSLVLIHSEKGEELFEQAKEAIESRISNENDCRQMNLEKPTDFPSTRDQFWEDYKKYGIAYIVNKYGTVKPLPQRILSKLGRALKSI